LVIAPLENGFTDLALFKQNVFNSPNKVFTEKQNGKVVRKIQEKLKVLS